MKPHYILQQTRLGIKTQTLTALRTESSPVYFLIEMSLIRQSNNSTIDQVFLSQKEKRILFCIPGAVTDLRLSFYFIFLKSEETPCTLLMARVSGMSFCGVHWYLSGKICSPLCAFTRSVAGVLLTKYTLNQNFSLYTK